MTRAERGGASKAGSPRRASSARLAGAGRPARRGEARPRRKAREEHGAGRRWRAMADRLRAGSRRTARAGRPRRARAPEALALARRTERIPTRSVRARIVRTLSRARGRAGPLCPRSMRVGRATRLRAGRPARVVPVVCARGRHALVVPPALARVNQPGSRSSVAIEDLVDLTAAGQALGRLTGDLRVGWACPACPSNYRTSRKEHGPTVGGAEYMRGECQLNPAP